MEEGQERNTSPGEEGHVIDDDDDDSPMDSPDVTDCSWTVTETMG